MRSTVFYLLHSTAIVGLMIGSYAYGFKQAANNAKESMFGFAKRNKQ
jgi:hypothetical protein